jgi:tetratricopeptide (TPR) repeat protein
MKSKLTNGIIGSMLLTLLIPTSIKAQTRGDIGTNRQQQTCPSRTEPRTGVISAALAIKYATCEAEADRIVKNPGMTDFLDISSLQVNPKPRRAAYADIYYFGDAITNSMVYEIKGSAIAYSCTAVDSFPSSRRGKNCLTTNEQDRGPNNSAGVCVRFPSGDWRCNLGVGGANSSQYGPPPSANAPGSSEPQTASNNSAQYYREQSDIKRQNKNYQGALADISRAIQIEPNKARFYYERAAIKYDLNDLGGAIKDLQQSAKLYQQQGNTKNYEALLRTIENIKK